MSQVKNFLMSATIAFVAIGTVIPAGAVQATTAADLQAQIQALTAQLQTLQSQLQTTGSSTSGTISGVPAGFTFAKTLALGSTGSDVKNLQIVLNSDPATQVAASGAGSSGKETTRFGPATKAAVIKFQEKYAASILTPSGLTKGTGVVGPGTRAKLNVLLGAAPTTTTTPTTVTPTTVTPTTGQFTVSLAPSNPASSSIVAGQALAPLAAFSFANGTGSDVKVTSLALKRIGISADTTLSNVYLFNGATRLTDAASVSSGVINFNISSGILTIAANSTATMIVEADIASSTSGQTVGVGLNSASGVTAGSTQAAGSFPINGNLMTIASATVATVDFNSSTTPSTTSIDPQNDYTVWQNIITVGTRAVTMSRLSLQQIGSVKNTDVQNFRLYVDGVQAGSAVASLDANGFITFDLSASPVRMETGSRTLKVLGDIIGGSNLNFIFSLRSTADATFNDSQLGVTLLPTANSSTFSARTIGTISVNSGVVTVVKRADSPASNVVASANAVTLARYDVKAAGEPVKIQNLIVSVASSDTAVGQLRNGAIFANGVQIGSTADLYTSTKTGATTTSTTYNFGSSLIVTPGSPVILEVRADIYDNDGTNSIVAADTLKVTAKTGSTNGFAQVSKSTSNVPSSDQDANTVTVQTGSLTISKYTGFAGPVYVVPQTNAKIAHFVITAGATEDVNLNTLTFDYVTGTASNVTNVYAKFGTDTLATKATISATGNSWSVNKTLAAGTSIDWILYAGSIVSETGSAEIQSNVTGTTVASANTVYGARAPGGSSNSSSGRIDGQAVTYGTGSFAESKSGATPLNQVVGANQTITAGAFTFSAQNDSYTIQELRYRVAASASNAISSVTLMNGTTPVQTSSFTITDSNTNDTVAFTNLSIAVPANTSKVLAVNVALADVSGANSAASGTQVLLTATYNKYASSTGTVTTDSTVGSGSLATSPASNTSLVYEAYPVFTADLSSVPTTFTNGSTATLYQFKVKAVGSGSSAISLKQLKFAVAFTNAVCSTCKVDQFKLFKGVTDITGSVTIRNEAGASIESTTAAVSSVTGSTGPAIFITWDSGNEDQIAAGSEYTYQLQGVPANFQSTSSGTDTVSFQLSNAANDTTYGTRNYLASQSSGIYALATSSNQSTGTAADIIWSDLSGGNASSATTIHTAFHNASGTGDWANSYLLLNLPATSKGLHL